MKGASPWKRGVRSGMQVLVCPQCQRRGNWMADLDQCPECESTMLVRLLGETHCRACGRFWSGAEAEEAPGRRPNVVPAPAGGAGGAGVDGTEAATGEVDGSVGLANEVEAALNRFFGRA